MPCPGTTAVLAFALTLSVTARTRSDKLGAGIVEPLAGLAENGRGPAMGPAPSTVARGSRAKEADG